MQEQLIPPPEIADLIVVTPEGCWEWQGRRLKGGYGHYKGTTAHRWVYALLVGPVQAGLHVDHLCRNRPCVNPAHLEPVTARENLRRGQGHGSETHCPHGHPYDEANTAPRSRGSGRNCRECDRKRAREYSRRKRAEMGKKPKSLTPRARDAWAAQVLAALERHDVATGRQLIVLTGLKRHQVYTALRDLRTIGRAEQVDLEFSGLGGRPGHFWRLA